MDDNTLEAIKIVAAMLAAVGGIWGFAWFIVTLARVK